MPPLRSPILTTSVEKSASSKYPRHLCETIKYSGALSSTSIPSSHLTGLNSGAAKMIQFAQFRQLKALYLPVLNLSVSAEYQLVSSYALSANLPQ